MTYITLKMALRRWSLNCKLKTRMAFLSLFLILLCISVLYRALSSEDAQNGYNQQLFPSLDKKRPIRFHSKHLGNFDGDQPIYRHVDNLRRGPESYMGSLKDRDLLSADSRSALTSFLAQLYPVDWTTAPETDDVALEMKYLLLDYGFESKMSCKDIDSLRIGQAITFTRTKFVEYGYFDSIDVDLNRNYYDAYNSFQNSQPRRKNSDMAIKSPSNDIDTKIQCMKQIYDAELCSAMGNYRFLREVLLMVTLHHPCIPILKGYCLRGKSVSSTLQNKGLILVTEVGTPLTQSLVYASSWRQRLSYALQISELLSYLDSSPLGTLRLSKVQLKDFVLVGGATVKLVDLDDLLLGEMKCTSSLDCQLPDSHRGMKCSRGVCDGYNSLFNLNLVSKQVLLTLLHNPSTEQGEELVEKLQTLDTNIAEVVAEIHSILSKTPPDPPPKIAHPPVVNEALGWRDHLGSVGQQGHHGNSVEEMRMDNRQPPVILAASGVNDLLQFTRIDQKNFPGLYDYSCLGSRVTWGCVFTVTNLNRAASLCYKDPMCKSFITFSTKPEIETLMTVLLKNATDIYPQNSSGTTLFIKNFGDDSSNGVRAKREHEAEDEDDDEDFDEDEDDEDMAEIRECVERTTQLYESARYSREKRLMAHLGLKGIREQSWRRSALEQTFANFSRIVKAGGGGGKFHVFLQRRPVDDMPQMATKATFVAEDGPKCYHLAYTLVYHLDRILGFYHTPPCVGKKLTSSDLEPFHLSTNWESAFQPLIESDGSLSGILMTPVPRVMKLSKVTLEPREAMTSQIERFERPDKLQLEYMVLSWLTGLDLASNDHLGFKGHLIHFSADQAFRNTSVNFSGYLLHCQFPNVAYKSLLCFRCKADAVGTTICGLGQEAAMRLRSMFDDEVDLTLHERMESQLMEYINAVASHIMLKVDMCIKKFGRENVLY